MKFKEVFDKKIPNSDYTTESFLGKTVADVWIFGWLVYNKSAYYLKQLPNDYDGPDKHNLWVYWVWIKEV